MLPSKSFMLILFLAMSGSLILMWLYAALKGMRGKKVERRWQWIPPLGDGAQLVLWSADVAERISNKRLGKRRTKTLPTELASEVLTGTTFAIKHLPLMNAHVDPTDCRTRPFGRIGVTAPEVLAIADRIRPDKQEASRIHDLAVENTKRLVEGADDENAKPLVCPLRSNEGTCLAGPLCPLHCRVTCDLTEKVRPEHVKVLENVSRDVGFGVEVGLARALNSAGLDGHVYELNSALAVALEIPDASKRWAQGENVLAKCMPDDYSAYM